MTYAHVHRSLIMVPMGTHLTYVVFKHHFSQKTRKKNPYGDIKCAMYSFLVKSLLTCVVCVELEVGTSWEGHWS